MLSEDKTLRDCHVSHPLPREVRSGVLAGHRSPVVFVGEENVGKTEHALATAELLGEMLAPAGIVFLRGNPRALSRPGAHARALETLIAGYGYRNAARALAGGAISCGPDEPKLLVVADDVDAMDDLSVSRLRGLAEVGLARLVATARGKSPLGFQPIAVAGEPRSRVAVRPFARWVVAMAAMFGTTFPGYYAMFAARHMHDFGTTREQLAAVAVKNHRYGALNPNAMFQKEVTAERVLASDPVASPFCVFDCCSNADGAACLILADEETVAELGSEVVWLDGVGCASDAMSVLRRPHLVGLPAAARPDRLTPWPGSASGRQGGRGPRLLHHRRDHGLRGPGFCWAGGPSRRGPPSAAPVRSVDGGLKAKGHPIGATGVSMTCEIAMQLRGECGPRQVPGAAVGLTHNVGGIGQYCFVNVLRRD
jgi:acetyl-CoA C-acetyltransferase